MTRYQKTLASLMAMFIAVFALFSLVCPMQVNAMSAAVGHGCDATEQAPAQEFPASIPCLQNHIAAYLSMVGPIPEGLLAMLGMVFIVLFVSRIFCKMQIRTSLHKQQAVDRFIRAVQHPTYLFKAQRWFSRCVTNESISLA